jgi:large subunit ribosomal protein L5
MSNLLKHYETELRPQLQKEFGLPNLMAVPRLEKIVLNMGVGRAAQDSKVLTSAQEELSLIAGQRAVLTQAKRSIAAFKLRQGMNIGTKVTLRKQRMYDFLERLVVMALPRVRNYQGASLRSFDSCGNYALGVPEHTVFYEVYSNTTASLGLDVVFVTSTTDRAMNQALLKGLGIPFRERGN